MKKNNMLIIIAIVMLIFIGTGAFMAIKIRNLQNGFEISLENLNKIDVKSSHYSDSFGKILETNIFNNHSFTDSLKVGVKINDYGCMFCNNKILNRLKKSFDKNKLLIILNTDSPELINNLNLNGYHVLIDTLQSYNFKSIEPVVFLGFNNYYIFPYSPEMVLAPELFDTYINKIDDFINNKKVN